MAERRVEAIREVLYRLDPYRTVRTTNAIRAAIEAVEATCDDPQDDPRGDLVIEAIASALLGHRRT